jgi:uncharacterized membrane protein YesL
MKKTELQIQGGILGAACFAALIQSLSVSPPLKTPLLFAVFALAVAIPTNVLRYLLPDLSNFRQPGRRQPLLVALYFWLVSPVGYLSALLSVAFLFWHFCGFAACVFLLLSALCFAFLMFVSRQTKRDRLARKEQ